MKKNNKKYKVAIFQIVAYILLILSCVVGSRVFAATTYNWATGNYTAIGNTTEGMSHYECLGSYKYCPRWMLVSQEVYSAIRNDEGRRQGSYSELPSCEGDPHVIIAGSQNYAEGSTHDYPILYNLITPDIQNNAKKARKHFSIAESNTNVYSYGFLGLGNSAGVTDDDGNIMTYGQILDKVIEIAEIRNSKGELITNPKLKEEQLAVVCPSMVEEPSQHYSESNVSIGDGSVFAMTRTRGEQYTTDPYAEAEIEDQEVIITFSHNAYTKVETDKVGWYVTAEGLTSGDGYDVQVVQGDGLGNGPSPVDFKTRVGTTAGYLYTASDSERPGVSSGRHYISRSQYKITFKKEGEYTFCEAIGFDGEDFHTKACAKLNFKGAVKYYSESEAYVLGGSSKSTGIQESPLKRADVGPISIILKPGGTDTKMISFSHDIFSNVEKDDVHWSIDRSSSLSSGSGYYVERKSGVGIGSGSNPVSLNTKVGDYYTAANSRKVFNNNNERVISSSYYEITFSSAGKYEFCESISVSGKDPITKSCVTFNVTQQNKTQILSGTCADWAPPSFLSSNSRQGVTSVVVKVRNETGGWDNYHGVTDEGTNPQTANQSKYASQRITYAKPGDKIVWQNCYYPGVQFVANTERTYIHMPDSGDGNNTNDNRIESSFVFGTWQNKYNITTKSDNSRNGFLSGFGQVLPIGSTDIRQRRDTYTIKATNDTGKYFEETITSGIPVYVSLAYPRFHSWGCYWGLCCDCDEYGCHSECWCRTCWHTNHYTALLDRKNIETVSGAARVEVPYNYRNTTSLELSGASDNNDLVYAGEVITVNKASVTVGKKNNSNVPTGEYATQVDEARTVLVAYISDYNETSGSREYGNISGKYFDFCENSINWATRKQCEVVQSDGVVLNYHPGDHRSTLNGGTEEGVFRILNSGNNSTRSTSNYSTQYNVFDASAGDYMCFAMAVYPANSGTDDNLDPSGSDTWAISKECRIIAKKPSVQVTGGSVYTNGDITAIVSSKRNLYRLTNYAPFNPVQAYFGSWAEEAVVANGKVRKFASGAALGKTYENGSGYGASRNNFCTGWIPLSFANYTLDNFYSGLCNSFSGNPDTNFSGGANIAPTYITKNRAALVDYFATGGGAYYGNAEFDINNKALGEKIPSGTGRDIWYYDIRGTANVNGGAIGNNSTRVIKASGEVNIDRDIEYNTDSMTSMNDVPKVVIYSASNIHIACGVSRVDAILIAEGTVYSCGSYAADNTAVNNYDRSINQLVINGVVIANKVEFARTYGNAAGEESGTPAEVINYDTSAVLWERSMAGAAESDTLTTVYTRELSPRY
ncbi:hypothetical protein IKG68_02700 [Candidatus Saccharibacteria bacterium]|nr:hypothetical protein [Candidatus Saccharibacteria bacterium]